MALRTGMRQGELIGLQWGDIDFHGGFIEVRRTNFNGHISTPKSGRVRRVDMSDQLVEVLSDHKRKLTAEALRWGRNVAGWVFPGDEGAPLEAWYLRKRFSAFLKAAGIRQVPFHALRHSFSAALIGLGESLAYVQAQLGHHSIQMTVDNYGHLIPGANRKAVNRLDTLGNPQPPRNREGAAKAKPEKNQEVQASGSFSTKRKSISPRSTSARRNRTSSRSPGDILCFRTMPCHSPRSAA